MDVFNFELTAYDQKNSFNTLQNELTNAFKNSSQVKAKRVLDLFPVFTSNTSEIIQRSPIKFKYSANYVESNDVEDKIYVFGDEALGQVLCFVPKSLSGTVSVTNNNSLLFVLKDKLEIQVNKLAEMGHNRSAFQIIDKFEFNKEVFITVLHDSLSSNKITNLIVYLTEEHVNLIGNSKVNFLLEATSFRPDFIKDKHPKLFRLDGSNCTDVFDEQWYVYKLKGDPEDEGGAVCHIDKHDCTGYGGKNWEILSPPLDSKEEAVNWRRNSSRCANKGDD